MTAVASPPSLQPLPRWSSSNSGEGIDSMSAEEVTRMFMPRKSAQRINSSTSTTSSSSSSSSIAAIPTPQTNGGETPTTNGEGGWGPRKKATRGLWPSSKAEPVSGISTARPQALPTPSSGQSAASTMNAMHQPSQALTSQNRPQGQPNGARLDQSPIPPDSPAILALHPMTGTFERKQIVVPFQPEVLRIGRQTNVKTQPTAVNGFFDSKVLSRQHAEVWASRDGKIWIRDVKSSNGTFVNGTRLSPENRDSEPHELREQDILELGIDIVSEDQKSIVHHKVSAKVELAGIYPNPPSLLEIELNHNNSSPGNGMMGEPMSQQLSQMRGRGGSQGSIGSNGRLIGSSGMPGSNTNMLGPQRQVNLWMGPITIEQVVKRLATEFKQAKQQTQELHHTKDFFNALLTLEPGQEPPKSPHKLASEDKQQIDGVLPPPQLDSISPFSQPPAPPPQQPLPEKPDAALFRMPESMLQPSLKRTETERPRSALDSPTRTEPPSSQTAALLEALKSQRKEIESQGDRVKYLELALDRERRARENAERRARSLSGNSLPQEDVETNSGLQEEAFEPPLDSLELMEKAMHTGHLNDDEDKDALSRSASMATMRNPDDMHRETENIDASTSRLQARLDLMVKEMDDMKMAMESYKRRAEDAEAGRRSLAEMVENLRAGRNADSVMLIANAGDSALRVDREAEDASSSNDRPHSKHGDNRVVSSLAHVPQMNGSAVGGNIQRELEKTVSNVLQQQQRQWSGPGDGGRMAQSAPYVSMVGVVLIGIGIMTWLNGWQPGGEK